MIDRAALVTALRKQLAGVEADLRTLSDDSERPWGQQLRAEYDKARAVGRTALTWTEWREGEVAQAGVAWVLGAVFVRFCEDNGLLEHPFIAGAGARLAEATDAETHFYRDDPSRNTRDWLREGFLELARHPATQGLVDPAHSPVWSAPLSADACADILRFWRAQEADGSLTWSLADPDWDTRFLGDLYQDLSEFAKKKFALLQTPDFVEEFILDRTLTPALEQVPLAELRLVDPTCGSGHFLLGAFDRLLDAWLGEAPAMDTRERIQRVLEAVNGVDINPFAVAIARFRLTLAAFKAAGVTQLEGSPSFRPRVAVGDSLLASRPKQLEMDFGVEDPDSVLAAHRYAAEDVDEYPGILERGRYHVVVGNPPYITVGDDALNQAYRDRYRFCYREYALTVPFMELFFSLAIPSSGDAAGWVGQITSNSFMAREFGVRLIEGLLSGKDPILTVDLSLVVDTSGAYIPGHGTPTVILIGRRQRPATSSVRSVLGVRGEPGQPEIAAEGRVWSELVEHVDDEDTYQGEFVTVTDVARAMYARYPWSMSGGAAPEVKEVLDAQVSRLGELVEVIGYTGQTNANSVFLAPERAWRRQSTEPELHRQLVVGMVIRDFTIGESDEALFPYTIDGLVDLEEYQYAFRRMWPYRTVTWNRATFAKLPYRLDGRTWWEWHQVALDRLRTPLSIAFAEIATHNHFVLDRGGKVFNQTAPVIKLREESTEDEYLELFAVLNSSVACFWLKQVCHNKGVGGIGGGIGDEAWEPRYVFNGSKLQDFPFPQEPPLALGRMLDDLAQELQLQTPGSICSSGTLSRQLLDEAHVAHQAIRAQMIAWQEELDWHCYRLYGLVDEDLTTAHPEPLHLGQRAFEVALARKVLAGEEDTAWFERHGSTPITDIPADWPDDYKQLVQKRLDLIANDRSINLLERPEYKRRWASESWESMEKTALTTYVLDRLERADLWTINGAPQTLTVAQLADAVRHDEGVQAGLDLLYGANADRVKAISALMAEEAVPYLAAYRYRPSGMTKRAEWEAVWDLQRREDAGETVDIPVPPKYAQADFRKPAYWKARGKLDVPKERFILYPGAERANDATAVYGWAGWDHGGQAQALAGLLVDRQDNEGWEAERVTPLLAGLVELEPWMHQWYDEIDPEYGTSLAQDMTALLETRLSAAGLTREDARAWRPAEITRGRRSAAARG